MPPSPARGSWPKRSTFAAAGLLDRRHRTHHRQQPARFHRRSPRKARSTLYASDLAKGFKVPDRPRQRRRPGACMEVACLAFAYQQQFEKDFLIDLIGYRRYGHNELDEPGFTQPLLYETVRSHPTARQLWADALVEHGVIGADEAEALGAAPYGASAVDQRLARQRRRTGRRTGRAAAPAAAARHRPPHRHGRAGRRITAINESLKQLPQDFTFYSSRLESAIRGRREAVEKAAAQASRPSTGRRPRSWRWPPSWRKASPCA